MQTLRHHRATRFFAGLALILSATLVCEAALAAPATLESIAVTPAASSIGVGHGQAFAATGTFSNGSTQRLGPAIRDIGAGERGTCVLLASGGVKCWGDNEYGQLGDGTATDSLIARRVKGISNAIAVDLQSEHGCAVLDRGAAKCWGFNRYGQLGDGTVTDSSVPVPVTGIRSATAVVVGWAHSCALLSSGAVKCWGYNYHGELGVSATARFSSLPVRVAGISTATAITTAGSHNCALLASGQVQCWGLNLYGQLGNGSTSDSSTPVTVAGITSAKAVAAGAHFSCALLASGAVKCWGHGRNAELGDGTAWPYSDSSVPVSVVGINGAVSITAGAFHACAVMSDASAQCWGYNNYGQLGNGSMTQSASNTPVRISGIDSVVRLAAGAWHTCALLPDGAMRCWGLNVEGQLGNRRTTGYVPTRWPVNVIGTPGVVWSSSDPTKATITYGGRATGRSVGNATITATTAGHINDNAVLTVE
jgi:alpha-tubulin suppressor-like RCC1 family protein